MLIVLFKIACWVVIVLHVWFAVFEMVLWPKLAPRIFRITREFAALTAPLAFNQGLYNAFLASAMVIGMFAPSVLVGVYFMIFGLTCAIIAGIGGWFSVSRRIFYVQGIPAIIALALLLSVVRF